MRLHDCQLDSKALKVTQNTTLWKSERGILEIGESALAIQVRLDSKSCGYIFCGKGNFILDAIVETKRGAIGKPVEREISEPFLMLGKLDRAQDILADADEEDFGKAGFKSQQHFLSKAEDLFDRFFNQSSYGDKGSQIFGENSGVIFALPNEKGKLDILLAKGSKLVYKAIDRVFVSKGDKVVLKSRGEVCVSHHGKSVIVKNGCYPSVHICKDEQKWVHE